jgi:hypothetical protein
MKLKETKLMTFILKKRGVAHNAPEKAVPALQSMPGNIQDRRAEGCAVPKFLGPIQEERIHEQSHGLVLPGAGGCNNLCDFQPMIVRVREA